MSSILTNTSAMVALQTLKSINSGLSKVQSEISTGKTVATARDNAAVWAISKVMESDVKGFKGISDSLSLGSSTLTVAREAAEKIQGLLTDIKEKVVSAQSANVPREKLQTDIDALRGQIAGIVSAAQFSGLNMISGSEDVKFLASLNRSDAGVTTSDITVSRQDMGTAAGVRGAGTALGTNAQVSGSVESTANSAVITLGGTDWATAGTMELTVGGTVLRSINATGATADTNAAHFSALINAMGLEGVTASATGPALTIRSTRAFSDLSASWTVTGNATGTSGTLVGASAPTTTSLKFLQRAETVTFSNSAAVKDGDGYTVTIGSRGYTYVAGKGETMEDVARGLKIALDAGKQPGITSRVNQNSSGAWVLNIDNDGTSGASLTLATAGNEGGKASGGLFGLDSIDVSTVASARSALENIETMINRSIDAAAEFGSAQGRIDIQRGFVTALTDALKAGIGTLVDADMEEASARLQALQVQQQLGIQALSIANQQPQNLLALFR